MVRGLTVGIYHNKKEEKPEIPASDIKKKGENPSFIIDGVSLAYHILSNKDKDHSWEFANGGDYKEYTTKMIEFFKYIKKLKATYTIVFPLPEGTAPVNDIAVSRWTTKTQEKIRRINKVRTLLEKAGSTSRNLQDVLPPFMLAEIAETAAKLKIPVVYTRNPVTRFIAHYVASGKADAVIGLNSDYVIFPNVPYIPIDSFFTNEQDVLMCEYLDSTRVCDLIGLEDESRLFELSVLLGNIATEPFVVQKYNIYTLLHIKPNPKYPAALVEGIVAFLNKEEFEGLENTTPVKELIDSDEEFKAAIEESRQFFDLTTPLVDEGDSEVVKRVQAGQLPPWAVAIAEGGDFWFDPIVDDYKHEVTSANITLPIRKIIYGILGREKVVEHIPTAEDIVEKTVEGEKDLPSLEHLGKMKKLALERTFYNIAHALFPEPPDAKKDPINKIDEPLKTIGLALRYLVSQCFTENQVSYTKLPEDQKKLKDAGVIGAPPVDMYELRALAAQALCLSLVDTSSFQAPAFKPKLRRMHVSALYQSVLAHMMWLQQVFSQKSDRMKPHYFYDGQIFAAAYDAEGVISGEKFAPFFEKPEQFAALEDKRLDPFIKAVMYPFPEGLFEAFNSVPRAMAASAFEEAKPQQTIIIAKRSTFADLMDDEEEDEPIEAPPAPVIAPPVAPPPKAKKVEKKQEMDEDEEMAFLMAMAAENKKKGGEKKIVTGAVNKKQKGPTKRRVEKVNINEVRNFNKESKLEAKMQLRQQGFDW